MDSILLVTEVVLTNPVLSYFSGIYIGFAALSPKPRLKLRSNNLTASHASTSALIGENKEKPCSMDVPTELQFRAC